jgi:hypothetical protein
MIQNQQVLLQRGSSTASLVGISRSIAEEQATTAFDVLDSLM